MTLDSSGDAWDLTNRVSLMPSQALPKEVRKYCADRIPDTSSPRVILKAAYSVVEKEVKYDLHCLSILILLLRHDFD